MQVWEQTTGGRAPPAVPAWIVREWAGVRCGLKRNVRLTLEAVAAAGRALADGTIVIESAGTLWQQLDVSRSTYFAHLAQLEARGYLERRREDDRRATLYTIPGNPPGDPQALLPGTPYDQPVTISAKNRSGLRTKNRSGIRTYSQHEPHSEAVRAIGPDFGPTHGNGMDGLYGVVAQPQKPSMGVRNPDRAEGVLGHLEREDLTELERLREVYARAQAAGLVRDSEHDWQTVVACALHALRVARRPEAMFVALLRGREFLLPNVDYDQAVAWIRRAEHGVQRRRRDAEEEVWEE